MTSAMPPLASFTERLRTALHTTTAAVSAGFRRNARSALEARTADPVAAGRVLAALAQGPDPREAFGPIRKP